MSNRKLPRRVPFPAGINSPDNGDRNTPHGDDERDLLESVDCCWPWPFSDESVEEAFALAGGRKGDPKIQGAATKVVRNSMVRLRRHCMSLCLAGRMGLLPGANPGKEVPSILKALATFIDACRRLSPDAFAAVSAGGAGGHLAAAMREAATAEFHLRKNGLAAELPKSQGGAPKKLRNILIGDLDEIYTKHLGEDAGKRRQFIAFCLKVIGEPAELDTIEKAIQRERADRKELELSNECAEGDKTTP